jgi:hypothetical protein
MARNDNPEAVSEHRQIELSAASFVETWSSGYSGTVVTGPSDSHDQI